MSQRKLPSKEKLKSFLDQVSDYAQSQEELGEKKGNLHYQGCFKLSGPTDIQKFSFGYFQG